MSTIEKAMGEKGDEEVSRKRPGIGSRQETRKSGTARAGIGRSRVRLDSDRLAHRGLLTPSRGNRQLEEEYRLAKRPLLVNAFQRESAPIPNGNLIMVTSALAEEGKSFNAFNLALSIARELDYTVLLVDGDTEQSSLTDWLGKGAHPGFADILANRDLDLGEVILQTDLPNLRFLPAGHAHPRSTELMASGHMRRISDELARRYPDRVVIFDSPPLLMTSQASVLARVVGQVLLVVESGKTPQHLIHEALGLLNIQEQWVGCLLNKSQRYGSAYGGYYGHYG